MAPFVSTITTTITKNGQIFDNKNVIEKNRENTTKLKETEDIVPYKKNKFLIWEFGTPLIWKNIILIFGLHILSFYLFVTHDYYSHPWIVLYGLMLGGIGGFGVTGGAHRYFTHRSFKAKLPLRIIFLLCYAVAGQNSLKDWVRDHRVHHKFSETDADPHNSKRGFFFAHVGWLMMKKHPDVLRKGRQVDCSDLFEDPLVVLHQKYFPWLRLVFCFIIPTVIPPLMWGELWTVSWNTVLVRYTFNLNFTWLVNSAAHIWGTKPYDTRIKPVENLTVSCLAMGEGYHNYHHTFPWDYRASEMGRSLNVTTFWLNIFSKIGWAYDMKSPSEEIVIKVAEKHGDGSRYKWGHEVPYEESEDFIDNIKKPL